MWSAHDFSFLLILPSKMGNFTYNFSMQGPNAVYQEVSQIFGIVLNFYNQLPSLNGRWWEKHRIQKYVCRFFNFFSPFGNHFDFLWKELYTKQNRISADMFSFELVLLAFSGPSSHSSQFSKQTLSIAILAWLAPAGILAPSVFEFFCDWHCFQKGLKTF